MMKHDAVSRPLESVFDYLDPPALSSVSIFQNENIVKNMQEGSNGSN